VFCGCQSLFAEREQYRRTLHRSINDDIEETLSQHAAPDYVMYEYDLTVLEGMAKTVVDRVQERRVARTLCEQALARAGITALVCVSDNIAVECQDLLRERGVDVPRDMALTGFDDSLTAVSRKLTSYQFNTDGLALAASNHIVEGHRPDYLGHGSVYLTVAGTVMLRESSDFVRRA